MGMAASQSRFLGLTARKTNVEYRGQQINQARTALANRTADLYNEMLSLKVPTPPTVSDYYNTSYTFTDGDTESEIISGLGTENCQIKTAHKELRNYVEPVNSGYPSTIHYETGIPYLNGNRLTRLSGDEPGTTVSKAKLEAILQDGVTLKSEAPFVMSNGTSTMNITNWSQYKAAVQQGYSFEEGNPYNVLYSYTKNDTTYYVQSAYIPEEDTSVHKVTIPQEFYENVFTNYTTQTMTNCSWGRDASGRYANLTGNINGMTKSYDLRYIETNDQTAYEQAMQNYQYEYAIYEKKIEDINAKTAKIQEQDRTLELQLRQCDTEQQALAKELDSVKSIIKDSIDRVFKTFS